MLVFRGRRRKYLIYFLFVFISLVFVFAGIIHLSVTTSGIAIAKEIIRYKFDANTRIHQLFNLTILTQPFSIVAIGTESKIASPSHKARLPDPSELGVFELCGSTGRHYDPSTTSGREEVVRVVHMSWKNTTLPPRFAFYQKSWCHCFPRWRHFLWTDADNERLVQFHYSWFYAKYRSFDKNIFRIDSVRYLYLHRYGGIYTDLDNVCLRPFEKLLSGGPPLSFGDMDGERGEEGWMYIQNSYVLEFSYIAFLNSPLACPLSSARRLRSSPQVDVLARGARVLDEPDAEHRACGRARASRAGDRAVPADGGDARWLADARLRGRVACVRGASVQPVLVDLERPRRLPGLQRHGRRAGAPLHRALQSVRRVRAAAAHANLARRQDPLDSHF